MSPWKPAGGLKITGKAFQAAAPKQTAHAVLPFCARSDSPVLRFGCVCSAFLRRDREPGLNATAESRRRT